ncbi:flagellar biosynthetic protein FliO [Thermomicrobium sp. 4228-Ro]|uniref:FliO/MopB family protein n=1 Tax=Thermomicrobium sp. 4228-Ro TaxID=2993937 RepID=UPI0022494860|nr:flagellar biosynthetic protein FliO [Thermomicrobium sp. 4228-Ro]MCX2727941.1 flagellar biosynthetic protein FliO [Thermomicrobium sp. 4228-Ro]
MSVVRSVLHRRWVPPLLVFGAALLVGLVWAGRSGQPAGPAPPTPASDGFLARGYAELESERVTVGTPDVSSWDLLGAMLVPTLIVLIAAYATIRLLRTLNRRVAAGSSRTQLLELVDTLSLAGSGVVHIVRLGERYLLVGVGTGGLSLLTELRPEEIEILKTQGSSTLLGQATLPPFREVLQARLLRPWRILETPTGTETITQPAQGAQRFGHIPEAPSARHQEMP